MCVLPIGGDSGSPWVRREIPGRTRRWWWCRWSGGCWLCWSWPVRGWEQHNLNSPSWRRRRPKRPHRRSDRREDRLKPSPQYTLHRVQWAAPGPGLLQSLPTGSSVRQYIFSSASAFHLFVMQQTSGKCWLFLFFCIHQVCGTKLMKWNWIKKYII